jgi:hypothetical protein
MRIPSVFAIVLVGTAGIASAQPKQEENNERVRYGDHDADKRDAARHDAWTQLATPTPAKHGTEFVVVGKEQGNFDKLRLDADSGRVIVRRVKIIYDDGQQKVVDLDRVLAGKHKSATIDLQGPKAIDRIVVTTEPETNGMYAIYGSSGTVATR